MNTIGPRLTLRQTPALALTPELRQAIRLLQMPTTDLVQHIQQELELNPLLERADQPAPAPESSIPAGGVGSASMDDGRYSERWADTGMDGHDREPDLPSRSPTLREHLTTQIATDIAGTPERVIAMTLLEGLDEAGYLTSNIHE